MSEKCQTNELPQGWSWSKLGDICDIVRGVSFPKDAKTTHPKDSYIACLRTRNVQNEVDWSDLWFIPITFVKNQEQFLRENDILISTANSLELVGKSSFLRALRFPSTLGAFICALRVHDKLDPMLIFFQLSSSELRHELRNRASTTTNISNISAKSIQTLDVKIAPLNEQHRTVAKLGEFFSRLDTGIDELRRVKVQLNRYRQAVLKYAFEGKLTEKWRKNHRDLIEPTSQLVNSIIKGNLAEWENDQLLQVKKNRQDQKNHLLKKKYKQPLLPSTSTQAGLPDYWTWVTADQLFWCITSGSRGWAKYYSEEGAFFVRVGDLSHDNISIDLKSAQHVNPPDGAELRRTRVSSGDILISITADIGRIALVPIGIKEAYINQHVALAKSVSLFSHSYLAWFLLSPIGQKQLTGLQYGATKAGLGLDDIGRVNIPLAPLVEQYELVEEIERRLSVLTEAEKVIEQNLKRANSLRQSILRTAFEGRLVPQDREDEPADKLLERIREERAKSKGEKNTNKRRKDKPRQLELSTYVK